MTKTILNVTGMSCANCVRHVSDSLTELHGVDCVEVSLEEARAVVRHDPALAPLSSLITAVADAGYDAARSD